MESPKLKSLVKHVPPPPWPRLTYEEAMLRYGSDRPDTRFGLELRDVSELLRGSELVLHPPVIAGGGTVPTTGAVRGTAYPGARVTVRADTGATCTFPADSSGAWGCVLGGDLRDGLDRAVGMEDQVVLGIRERQGNRPAHTNAASGHERGRHGDISSGGS